MGKASRTKKVMREARNQIELILNSSATVKGVLVSRILNKVGVEAGRKKANQLVSEFDLTKKLGIQKEPAI